MVTEKNRVTAPSIARLLVGMVPQLISALCSQFVRLFSILSIAFALIHGVNATDKPAVQLKDIEGHEQRPFDMEGRNPTALIFTTVDCPVANAFAPEIQRIVKEYSIKGIAFFLVHVDPDVTVADARKHAKAYGYTCPVLLDTRHELVKLAGAKITPEAAVFDAKGALVYHGRINNKYEDYGVKRQEATKHELRDALDDLLAGRKVKVPKTKVVGCYIPSLPDTAPRR